MSHRRIAVAAALALLPAVGAAQEDVRGLSPARVTAQVAAGTLTTPVAFFGVGALTKGIAQSLGASEDRASQLGYVGAWSGSALATAAVPAMIGARGPGAGSYWAALGGTVVGGAGSWLLVRANRRGPDAPERPCKALCVLTGVAVFALPSIGATVGYNLSREPLP